MRLRNQNLISRGGGQEREREREDEKWKRLSYIAKYDESLGWDMDMMMTVGWIRFLFGVWWYSLWSLEAHSTFQSYLIEFLINSNHYIEPPTSQSKRSPTKTGIPRPVYMSYSLDIEWMKSILPRFEVCVCVSELGFECTVGREYCRFSDSKENNRVSWVDLKKYVSLVWVGLWSKK